MSACRHGGVDSTEHMEQVLHFVRQTKEDHFRMRQQETLEGILPQGNCKAEGRVDKLFDFCLYFIAPHRLKAVDEEFIARLSKEVTVLPIWAKADAMTMQERADFQLLIRDRLEASGAGFQAGQHVVTFA